MLDRSLVFCEECNSKLDIKQVINIARPNQREIATKEFKVIVESEEFIEKLDKE